jgi:thiol-disulfide isomerase/thioredoxin
MFRIPLFLVIALNASQAPGGPAGRTADEIVQEASSELRAGRRSRTTEESQAGDRKLAGLVGELRERFPHDARLTGLLPERWWALLRLGRSDVVGKEVRGALATASDAKLRADAAYVDALMAAGECTDGRAVLDVAERFMKQAPGDDRAAGLLSNARMKYKEGDPERARLADRIVAEFPGSLDGRILLGQKQQDDRIGKPFELEFTDAISGRKISMKDLRGKVVVLDFWATWCGPCVAEIPLLKELYSRYQDRGVEFIGVSLDRPEEDGGLQELKDYVRGHGIPWPQYYLGQKFTDDFTTSWGIDAIPVSFVIDAEGKLFSTRARGKLDQMIPLLLKKSRPTGP